MDKSLIAVFKDIIEGRLLELSSHSSPFFPDLYEGGRYILKGGGRIRPLLTLATVEMLSPGRARVALDPACALECVHTYSLIHDDLPCMDNDDFRRGMPTLHRVYDEGHAVLIGDWLLTFAFQIIAQAPYLSPQQKIEIIETLSEAAGGEGMIGGQMMDLNKSTQIHELNIRKTGALFKAALKFGGIAAGADKQVIQKLEKFGLLFGEMFQLVDDLKDHDHALGDEHALESLNQVKEKVFKHLKTFDADTSLLLDMTTLVLKPFESSKEIFAIKN